MLLHAGFFKVHKIKEMKRKHTWTVQVMQKLVRKANLYEYEETGLEPSNLQELRTGGLSPELPADDDLKRDNDHKTGANMKNLDRTSSVGAATMQAEHSKGILLRSDHYVTSDMRLSWMEQSIGHLPANQKLNRKY